MKEYWFIDGFNLLHVIWRMPRERVFALLSDFAAEGEREMTVVLDGVGSDEEFAYLRTPVFQVVFSGKKSADAYIEGRLGQAGHGLAAVVVTRDRAVKDVSVGFGARVRNPEDFFQEVLCVSRERCREETERSARLWGFHRPFEGKF